MACTAFSMAAPCVLRAGLFAWFTVTMDPLVEALRRSFDLCALLSMQLARSCVCARVYAVALFFFAFRRSLPHVLDGVGWRWLRWLPLGL